MKIEPSSRLARPWLMALLWVLCLLQTSLASALTMVNEIDESVDYEPMDLRQILDWGYLTVAMLKTDEMPFFYHKDGELVGVDIELLEIMERKLGIDIRILRVPTTFDGVIDMVAQAKADIGMSYLSETTERAKRVNYTHSYALNYFAVAVNRVSESRARTGGDTSAFLNKSSTRLGLQMDSAY